MNGTMEPTTSTGAAGFAGWKLIGGAAGAGAIGAGLVSIVVMCMMTPRSAKEWAVGLICTVVASLTGGAAVIQYCGLQEWAGSMFGLVAMIGLAFSCGLPGWAIVRWTFNFMNKRKDATITDVAREIRHIGEQND